MPEGDTILRAARSLGAVLEGREIVEARSPLPEIARRLDDLQGKRIARVEARGKNLLIRFEDGPVLHTHMRMSGSWHLYRPGERWRKPERSARISLRTRRAVAVCFSAPVVRLLSPSEARQHPHLRDLGPDLLAPEPELDEAVRRLRSRNDAAIGEAVMLQHLVAGIGNVYKSEVLFLSDADPFERVGRFTDARLRAILERARDLMRRNLQGFPRRTRAGAGRYWVYGRSGDPCRRCGTAIRMRRQGAARRSTYFCPACQDAPQP